MPIPRTALITAASRAGSLAVAGVAGYASYRHITHVATMAGEASEVAIVYPLAIDGLIVVGTMAMLADKADGRSPRLSARVALGLGIIATLAANIASAQPTVLGRCVAAVPAIAFLAAVEVLARRGKLLTAEDEGEAAPTPPTSARIEQAAPELPAEGSQVGTRRKPVTKQSRRPIEVSRAMALEALARPGATRAAVAKKLHITERRLRQILNEATGELPAGELQLPTLDEVQAAFAARPAGDRRDDAQWLRETFPATAGEPDESETWREFLDRTLIPFAAQRINGHDVLASAAV